MTKLEREELKALSLQVFGTSSGYQKLLRGYPVAIGENRYMIERPTVEGVRQFMQENIINTKKQLVATLSQDEQADLLAALKLETK